MSSPAPTPVLSSDAASYPRVTTILRTLGLAPDFSAVDPGVIERAQRRGTAVHEAIEMIDWTPVDPEWQGYVEGYRRFQREAQYTSLASEVPVISSRWRYRGRLDQIGWMTARRVIVDVKTGASLYLPSVSLQLAAYTMAHEEMHPDQPIATTLAVLLRRNGTHRTVDLDPRAVIPELFDGRPPLTVWQAALVTYAARQSIDSPEISGDAGEGS